MTAHLSRWRAAPPEVRRFQAVFTLLTLNFLIPSVGYVIAPDAAMESFRTLGAWLGAAHYPVSEHSLVWRTLGATNVATLGLMCLLLQIDLVRFYPVLFPLTFMKGTTALLFLGHYLLALPYPGFLAVFLWDGLAVVLMLTLAPRARRALLLSAAHPATPDRHSAPAEALR